MTSENEPLPAPESESESECSALCGNKDTRVLKLTQKRHHYHYAVIVGRKLIQIMNGFLFHLVGRLIISFSL